MTTTTSTTTKIGLQYFGRAVPIILRRFPTLQAHVLSPPSTKPKASTTNSKKTTANLKPTEPTSNNANSGETITEPKSTISHPEALHIEPKGPVKESDTIAESKEPQPAKRIRPLRKAFLGRDVQKVQLPADLRGDLNLVVFGFSKKLLIKEMSSWFLFGRDLQEELIKKYNSASALQFYTLFILPWYCRPFHFWFKWRYRRLIQAYGINRLKSADTKQRIRHLQKDQEHQHVLQDLTASIHSSSFSDSPHFSDENCDDISYPMSRPLNSSEVDSKHNCAIHNSSDGTPLTSRRSSNVESLETESNRDLDDTLCNPTEFELTQNTNTIDGSWASKSGDVAFKKPEVSPMCDGNHGVGDAAALQQTNLAVKLSSQVYDQFTDSPPHTTSEQGKKRARLRKVTEALISRSLIAYCNTWNFTENFGLPDDQRAYAMIIDKKGKLYWFQDEKCNVSKANDAFQLFSLDHMTIQSTLLGRRSEKAALYGREVAKKLEAGLLDAEMGQPQAEQMPPQVATPRERLGGGNAVVTSST